MEKPEILVHISAPSGARDDARYSAQVEAILGFQSASRQNISIGPDFLADSYASSSEDVLSTSSTSRSREHEKNPDSDRELHGPSLGSKRNNDSPSVLATPGAATTESETPHLQEGCSSASTQIPESIVSGPPVSLLCQARESKSPQDQCSPVVKDSFGTPVSVIPDSQPTVVNPEPASNLEDLEPQLGRGNSATHGLPAKRRRADSLTHESQSNSRAMARLSEPEYTSPSAKATPPKTRNSTNCTSFPSSPDLIEQPSIQLTALPLTIRPPPPPVSTNPFSTHITPTLELLANRLKPSRMYKPTYQTRDLDKLERGHWFLLINISDSPATPSSPKNRKGKLQPNDWGIPFLSRAWAFLSSFIAKEARGGWGTWCILENAPTPNLPPDEARSVQADEIVGSGSGSMSPSTSRHLVLKVYTWGELACHVYLLLFLASERRIRRMGAQWRDAREEVVIQMP